MICCTCRCHTHLPPLTRRNPASSVKQHTTKGVLHLVACSCVYGWYVVVVVPSGSKSLSFLPSLLPSFFFGGGGGGGGGASPPARWLCVIVYDCFTVLLVVLTGFHPGAGKLPPLSNTTASPQKEGRREGRREREMWSLREAILFVGGVRERERRNAISCMCRCHAHLPPLTKFSI